MLGKLMELIWPYAKEQLETNEEELIDWILWHYAKGYLTVCMEEGEVVGAAFWWRIKDLENIPAFPEEEEGDYLYCPYGVGSIDMLPNMLKGAQQRFPGVKYFCFQRGHRGDDRMRIWRIKDE